MPYPIWIGTDKNGHALIGAEQVRSKAVDVEKIYPSQMAHRVVARLNGAIRIMTPTQANDAGAEVVATFPRADGALKRGY